MIWVTWRQQRFEALIGGAVLALAAIFLLKTGVDLATTYRTLGVPACLTSQQAICGTIIETFRGQTTSLQNIVVWFEFLPLLFGVLLAAPLVLEVEQGTYRLAWTQSITRTRWIAGKVTILAASALAVALALTGLLTWWRMPLDRLNGRFGPPAFDFEGLMPIAYTLYALALCLAVGVLLRRAIPAVGLTLVGFFVLRVAVEVWLRPGYLAPIVQASSTGRTHRGDWVMDQSYHTHAGQALSPLDVIRLCGVVHGQNAHIIPSCLLHNGIVNVITYQPADRFWLFQGIEGAIFLGLATGLLALTVWWVQRRIA